jgi:hypothetical protein
MQQLDAQTFAKELLADIAEISGSKAGLNVLFWIIRESGLFSTRTANNADIHKIQALNKFGLMVFTALAEARPESILLMFKSGTKGEK